MADALTVKVTADTKDAVDALVKLKESLQDTQEKARNIFAKGLSESLPEQLQDISHGFEIASDKSQNLSTRLQAGVGASLIAKNAFMELGSRVLEFRQAVDEANARTEAQTIRLRALGSAAREIVAVNGEAVSSTDAYALRVHLLGEGLQATGREQALIIELARRHALAGEDSAASITRVTAAINGDVAAQRLLGLSTAQGATAQERMREAVQLAAREHEQLGRVEETAAETAARHAAAQRAGSDVIVRSLGFVVDAYFGISAAQRAAGDVQSLYTAAGERLNTLLGRTNTLLPPASRGTGDLNTESGKLTSTTGRTKDQIHSLNDALARQRTLANEAATAQKELAESLQSVSLAARTGETSLDTVQRNLLAVNRALRDRDQQRRTQREVYRQAVAGGARASAVREVLGMAPAARPTTVPKWLTVSLEEKAAAEQERLSLLGSDEHRRMMRAKGIESDEAASAGLLGRDEYQRALRAKSFESDDLNSAGLMGRNEYGTALQGKQNENAELDAGNTFGARIGGAFRNTQTMAERTADSVKSSFDMMTNGLTGFMDTLIESPEKAGEAAVNLAKGILKGLAMMALQKSLFSTAEGIAALASGNFASAPGFFAAAGIYAGVAVAAGAGAAGIAASQRGATQATPPSSNSSGFGPARADSGRGGGQRGGDTYVISVNGSILDTGGFEQAVGRAVRGARGRGA